MKESGMSEICLVTRAFDVPLPPPAAASPHLAPDIVEELYQPLGAAGLADNAAVQTNSHHLGGPCTTLLEEGVESVLRRGGEGERGSPS
jgi:hypothetical protein